MHAFELRNFLTLKECFFQPKNKLAFRSQPIGIQHLVFKLRPFNCDILWQTCEPIIFRDIFDRFIFFSTNMEELKMGVIVPSVTLK